MGGLVAVAGRASYTASERRQQEGNLLNNLLQVSLKEFKRGTKVFQRQRLRLGPVLFAYENGFLSIESGEVTTVMNAIGEWHGRTIFSPEILRALAMVPPLQDPVQISYDGVHLFVGSMKIMCQWNTVSQAFIENLANPSLIDLLALMETVPRSEIGGTSLGNQIRSAHEKAERRITNAAKQLQDLEITEAEIRSLVDARIATRLQAGMHEGNKMNPILKTLNALMSVLESVACTYTGEAKFELYSLCENLDNDPAYGFEGREPFILKFREVLALFRGGESEDRYGYGSLKLGALSRDLWGLYGEQANR